MLVEATILGMGNDRLRFRRGGSVVIPHVMPFSLGLIKKRLLLIYTVFKKDGRSSFELPSSSCPFCTMFTLYFKITFII